MERQGAEVDRISGGKKVEWKYEEWEEEEYETGRGVEPKSN